jgi:anthranilate/para-aminobenzoate synthase component II
VNTRLLLIDNYDSFTYNLVQAFMVLGAEVIVHRNDALTVAAAVALRPTHLCVSPGPGTPQQAGVSIAMIRAFAGNIPVLGVCLGHQAIAEAFGGHVVRAQRLMHGKTSPMIVERESLPAELHVTAHTVEGEIMGLRHTSLNLEGVQFHPESVLTPAGPAMMKNFLEGSGGRRAAVPGN